MRATSLFCVLFVAHALMLVGRTIPASPWTPIAYLWQDLLIAIAFAAIDYLIRRKTIVWALYGILVLYAAINVPIARVLSSPLTWTMMRAAAGPLRDSITHYLTLQSAGAIALVLAAGLLFPLILSRVKFTFGLPMLVIAAVLAAIGPLATARLATAGFHRNAFGALWSSGLTRMSGGSGNWRASPFGTERLPNELSRYRGAAAGRNVVLVLLESTGARYLRPYGAADDPMPNLTKLAGRSIVFERAYAVYPESIKGLLSVLCSRYPAFRTAAESYAEARYPSLAQLLTDAGYRSALFHSGRFMYLGMEAVVQNRGFGTLEDAGAIGGNINSSFGVDEPAAVGRILSWIDALPQEQPFFITYLPVAGHHPYATPEPGPFTGDSALGSYRNALHYGDRSLGELLHGLQMRRLDEKTLFVIFGDHGEAFGQHEANFGHSFFIYDENVRVPYLIAAPGLIHEQARALWTASLIDTAPTILDLLGLPIPGQFQGSSLLDSAQRMALFFTDYSLGFLGLYDDCWKYILEVDSDRSQLYDVCKDPEEALDLSAAQTLRIEGYRAKVKEWIANQRVN